MSGRSRLSLITEKLTIMNDNKKNKLDILPALAVGSATEKSMTAPLTMIATNGVPNR
jgi:hypothetical protein